MDLWSRALAGFAEACRREALDGFLMSLHSSFGASLSELAFTTRQVVEGLAARDPRGRGDVKSPEREGWYFSFAGERMFVIAMAPCYSSDHSRYTFGDLSPSFFSSPTELLNGWSAPGAAASYPMRSAHGSGSCTRGTAVLTTPRSPSPPTRRTGS
ncbi:YqcI/YcgG family protein [Kitasatospora sp. NBC_00085]